MNKQKEKLAILVPYRNREDQLNVFVTYMKYFMINNYPEIEYKIVIIEQFDDKLFNRGKLLNIGAHMSDLFDYFILHDIDMLPISSDYTYSDKVYHLASYVYEQSNSGKLDLNYVSKLSNYAGGVLKISKKDFYIINGFHNEYWGWGGEDDELKFRLISNNIPVYTKKDINMNHFLNLKIKNDTLKFEDNPTYKKNTEMSIKSQFFLKNNIKFHYKNGLNTLEYKILNDNYEDNYRKISVLL